MPEPQSNAEQMRVCCLHFRYGGHKMNKTCKSELSLCRFSTPQKFSTRILAAILALLGILLFPKPAVGQGCVAAHSPQPLIAGLDTSAKEKDKHAKDQNKLEEILHNVSVTIGYREY